MVNKIQQTSSELSFDTNGIHAIDKNNANNIVTLNSSGMYLSTDGGRTGKTAITAEGITASAITTGEMVANRIRGGTLEALNGWSQWDLNEGSQYYYGNSLIRFYSMYNQIVQSTEGGTFQVVQVLKPSLITAIKKVYLLILVQVKVGFKSKTE